MTIAARPRLEYTPIPAAGERAARLAEPTMRRLGANITKAAKARVNVRTGRLRNSIGDQTRVSGTQVVTEVYATARYAGYVHDGTRPHEIVPRRAKALRFEIGGRVIFAKRVMHPGYIGNPYLASAVHGEMARAKLT